PSYKSLPPVRSAPINLSFRLRDLFGVSSRAEVARVLLLLSSTEPRTGEIVRAAGYSRQNVHEALNALVSAGIVFMRQRGTRDRWYALDIDRWANLLDIPMHELPSFVAWPLLLEVLWELLFWAESLQGRELSEYMSASEARQFVASHEIDLRALGVRLPDERRFLGSDYWGAFELMVVEALTQKLTPVLEGMA
ncbi:MAG: ArsR/SmtB family transcription factor, partial [Actinomycetota bacterium]